MTFEDASSIVGAALEARASIVASLTSAGPLRASVQRLRDAMDAHVFTADARTLSLAAVAADFDRRTMADELHVVHDRAGARRRSGGRADPVALASSLIDARGDADARPAVLAMLLDHYFVHLLGRLALRVWDDGDANANLDRVGGLLRALQGSGGSGHAFVADAETLLWFAIPGPPMAAAAGERLLAHVRALSVFHQTKIGLGLAASLGCQLRFGAGTVSRFNLRAERAGRAGDDAWLGFSLFAVMREYSRMHEEGIPGLEREVVVDALLGGLAADAGHVTRPPARHSTPGDAERLECAELFRTYRPSLLTEFERLRPTDHRYSTLSLTFDEAPSVVAGALMDALVWGEPWPASLNDLLASVPGEVKGRSKEALVRTLMGAGHGAESPRGRGGSLSAVVYDPSAGRKAFVAALRAMKA